MSILLRVIGGFWILITARDVWETLLRILHSGVNTSLGLSDLLSGVMLAGGIGLILLKEWGRWVLFLGCVALLVLKVGVPLLNMRLSAYLLRPIIFYGLFIALLNLPQAKSETR